MWCKWLLDNVRDIKSLRGANYVVDYMIKIEAYLIKCVIVKQLESAVLWLQSQAPATENRVWILVGMLFCLSCCHKIGSLKVIGKGEGMKQCVDGIGWSCENEGNVRPQV